MATKTSVYFSTREYRSNHGAEPRGFGSWAFCEDFYANRPDYLDHAFWVHRAKFGEAKKAAVAHFRAEGEKGGVNSVFVTVLS